MTIRTSSGAAVVAVAVLFLGAPIAHAQTAAQLTEQGRLALTNRQFDAALEALDRAIAADPESYLAHYYRGLTLANTGREREALDEFVAAADLNPGWGQAHRMATIAALNTGNVQLAWDQAIKAHQAGADVADAVNQLLAIQKAPGDLDQQLAAVRVFVAGVNTEKLEAVQVNPFGPGAATAAGAAGDPFSTSSSRATGVGDRIVAESQGDLNSLLITTRKTLADSRYFGLVASQELAQYLLIFEVDEIRGQGAQKPASGYMKLLDPRSGEEVYRRVMDLTNLASQAELNRDIRRFVALMEEWLIERSG